MVTRSTCYALVGKVISVKVTADRLRLVADGEIIAEQARCFGRDKFIFNLLHWLRYGQKLHNTRRLFNQAH